MRDTRDRENNKIVIVGNGFDISIGLKSSYDQFINYIKDRHHFLEDLELYEYNRLFLRKYENFKLNWSDFESLYEETVRNVNTRVQYENLEDSFEITVLNNAIKKLEKDFYEYMSGEYNRWLQQNTVSQNSSYFKKFSRKINPVIEKLLNDKNTFFINFNYTNTLEDIVEDVLFNKIKEDKNIDESDKISVATKLINEAKNRIAHIHGSIEDNNILFGGGFADRDDTVDIHYSSSLLNDKLFRIKENDKLNATRSSIMTEINKMGNKRKTIDEEDEKFDLYVIGHSMQGSDFPFLSKMLENADRVYIFYYEMDYRIKMEEIIKKLGSSIIEKITLVPFLEILYEYKYLLVSNYEEYQAIEPFLSRRFPREEILNNLILTTQHFIFKRISELTITPHNVNIVLKLVKKLNESKVANSIKRIVFADDLSEDNIQEINNSNLFIKLAETVERISFRKTQIDIEFLKKFIKRAGNLNYLELNNCTLLNTGSLEIDLSTCESLEQLEIIDCVFNPEYMEKAVIIISKNSSNIERLIIKKNTNIIMDNSLFENTNNLTELSIILSDTDQNQMVGHLEKLERLYIDCSASMFPLLTVGNEIKEVTIVGYPEEKLILSSLFKTEETELGFPKFRMLQLNSPDSMNSFENINIDVFLDVFSNEIKLIIDEHSISIDEYYKKYQPVQLNNFLNETKKIIENTISMIINNRNGKYHFSKNFEEFENWYGTISKMTYNFSDNNNNFISFMKSKLMGIDNKIFEREENYSVAENIQDERHTSKEVINLTEVDKKLFEYFSGQISSSDVIYFLENINKNSIVLNIYKKIIENELIDKSITEEMIVELKRGYFDDKIENIVWDFSNKWFVSTKELELSALQYERGMKNIPNIKGILESKNVKLSKKNYPDNKPFKYAQDMKRAWREVLEEEIILIKDEYK